MEIQIGTKGRADTFVERADTALEVGSGDLLVYSTPYMIALMEGAACDSLSGLLDEGKTSVGVALQIQHLSATPVGMDVYAEAEVTAVEANTITFSVVAFDESGKIGEGTHKRVIVTSQKFLDRTYDKL